MSLEEVTAIFQQTVRVALLAASPMLIVAVGSGFLIAVFQAATQVNEQTLSFVPKIVLTLAVFALLFPWIMGSMVEFGQAMLARIAQGSGP